MRLARRLPVGVLAFLGLFAATVLAHWPLLRLPYYWDEAGYYIPAAYDFFRRGTLIPYSTLSNAHPPLPSIYLAAWWRVFGFSPWVTRIAVCMVAALALASVYRLAWTVLHERRAAVVVMLLTGIYPVWFVQSTLAHADIFAAAGTLWGLVFLLEREHLASGGASASSRRLLLASVACFAVAALSKEIAIGTPLALAVRQLWRAIEDRAATRAVGFGGRLRTALALSFPALLLAAWFGYHRLRTGFAFGNPEYFRYNATATLAPMRVLLALAHRALHLTAHLNLFVPVMITFGCLLLPRRPQAQSGAQSIEREDRTLLTIVLAANWILFSLLGGALLTRYLLPLYPLVLLFCVDQWRQRLHTWWGVATLSTAAFVLGLFVNPPYRFAPEDTLAYRDSILLEQSAIAQVQARYPGATVLSAWPVTDGLTKPELGYVTTPMRVAAIDNFSYAQVARAAQGEAHAQEEGVDTYTVALLFSTKYQPPPWLDQLEGPLGKQKLELDQRYFDLHFDLPPETIASMLGGRIVWRAERAGQWAAIVHVDRPQLARLHAPIGLQARWRGTIIGRK